MAALGVGSAMVIRTLAKTREAEVVAGADIRPEVLDVFQAQTGGREYDSVEKLCADPNVDVVWVATPNHLHCQHVVTRAQHGRHVICVKPMALPVDEWSAWWRRRTRTACSSPANRLLRLAGPGGA